MIKQFSFVLMLFNEVTIESSRAAPNKSFIEQFFARQSDFVIVWHEEALRKVFGERSRQKLFSHCHSLLVKRSPSSQVRTPLNAIEGIAFRLIQLVRIHHPKDFPAYPS